MFLTCLLGSRRPRPDHDPAFVIAWHVREGKKSAKRMARLRERLAA